jgi:hydrogenase/urease accessory protein HupE
MNGNTHTRCFRGHCLFLSAIFLLVWPSPVHAHLVSTGFGPFFDGLTHLAMSPDDLLGVLALAMLSGLIGSRYGRAVLFTLTSAWLVGGLFGLQIPRELSLPIGNTLSFLLVGVLVAADRKLPLAVVAGLAVALGLLHGFLNGTAMARSGGGFTALLGISTGVFVVVTIIAAFVVSLRSAWTRVAVRVAGSWIAAIGLLMLGWTFRGVG